MRPQEAHLRLLQTLPVRTVVANRPPPKKTRDEIRKEWVQKNPDKVRAQQNRWRAKNREKVRLYWRAYRKRKREERNG